VLRINDESCYLNSLASNCGIISQWFEPSGHVGFCWEENAPQRISHPIFGLKEAMLIFGNLKILTMTGIFWRRNLLSKYAMLLLALAQFNVKVAQQNDCSP
jgi:hypothetical protein